MEQDTETRTCSTCGAEMTSQRTRYLVGGAIMIPLAIALAVMGILRTSGDDPEALLILPIAALFVWLGIKRVKAHPWYCPQCKSREFM